MRENIPAELLSIEHYALQVRADTIRDFDVKNASQLQATLSQLRQILVIKLMAASEGGISSQAQFQAFSVMKRVLDILVSAIQMARQRGTIETFILLRVALEASSTALHISRDQDAYERYMIGKYDSPKAITFAKAFTSEEEDLGVFHQAIGNGGSDGGVVEDVAPVGERCVGRNERAALIAMAGGDDLIEEVGSLLIERKIS